MRSQIEHLLNPQVIEIHKSACKNYANKIHACSLCRNACVTDAISFDDQTPIVEDTKCSNCGACVSACPTLAIDHIRKPYNKVKEAILQFPEANLICDQIEKVHKGIQIPCILFIDTALISQYSATRKIIEVSIAQCQTCKKADRKMVIEHIANLNAELKQVGVPLSIEVTEAMPVREQKVVDGITRRSFFQSFSITRLRERIFKTDDNEVEETSTSLTTNERMTFKKRLLHEMISQQTYVNKSEDGTIKPQTYSVVLQINHNCNGCSICEKICPTSAIYWQHVTEGCSKSDLMFDTAKCISCNKCLACPIEAISMEEQFVKKLNQEPILLMSFHSRNCISCNDEFKAVEAEEHCLVCRTANEKDPSRFFVVN